MNIIQYYSLRTVVVVYIIALLLFTLALQLVEVVTNLVRYIQLSVPLATILQLQIFFAPSSLHFAFPIAMLFATSFAIGNFHGTRELLAAFGVGISLVRFCLPVFFFAALISVAAFFFEDTVIVGTRARYQSLRESVLLINAATTNEFVALFGSDGNDVYYAEYYDAANESLVNPTFIERNVQGVITRRISARQAVWDGEYWILHDAHSYTWENANADVVHREHGTARLTNLEITPQSFQRAELQIGEMDIQEARDHIAVRRESGLPFRRELTIYHKRFAFSCTSLVVAIISCGIGGILKRNTLLLSMLLSLSVTVLYYVTGLITDLFAFNGYIAPAVAAWLPVCLFFVGGGFALKNLIHS